MSHIFKLSIVKIMYKYLLFIIAMLIFSGNCFAEISASEKLRLLKSQLAMGQEHWIELKSNAINKKLGVAPYYAFDSGSINKVKGIVYVNVLLVDLNIPVKHTAMLAFNCKIKKAIQLSENDDIDSAYYIWHDGKILFPSSDDGADYTKWRYPEKDFPEVNELFLKLCDSDVLAVTKHTN